MASTSYAEVTDYTLNQDHLLNLLENLDETDHTKTGYYELDKAIKLSYDKSFNTIHINIQSLPAKFEKLKNLLDTFKENGIIIDCLLLCETFLTNNTANLYNIPEYNLTYMNREKKHRGGVAIYIHEKHDFILRKDLSTFIEGEFESIFLEIKSPKPAIIGEIYRVPNSNVNQSITRYGEILQKLNKYHSPIVIGTDQNFDLLKIESHEKTQDLYNTFISNGFIPTITSPTRITHNTATLIDNIYTSLKKDIKSKCGILTLDISDHLPIFAFYNYGTLSKAKPKTFKYRNMSPQAIKQINDTLTKQSWEFLSTDTIHKATEEFIAVINKAIDLHTTEKCITLSPKSIKREKWMTKGLIKSGRTEQKLFRKQIGLAKNHPSHVKFIKYRNMYNSLKRRAKHEYYTEVLEKHKTDIRQTWRELNKLLGKSNDKTTVIKNIDIDGEVESDPFKLANGFANYFSKVGDKYNQHIQQTKHTFDTYLRDKNMHNIFMSPTDSGEIQKIIASLKSKSTCGIDNISSRTLKDLNISISQPLTVLINRSILEGTVPNIMKIARVKPLHKSKDRSNLDNYRPISILASISKVLEKVVFKRVYNFFDNNSLFSENQFGFRPGHSTTDATLEFTQSINKAFENNESSIGLFCDLSKAFDTVEHAILLKKLEHYGIRGIALKWFESYLSERKLYVQLDDIKSDLHSNLYGVPQGSILGPLLFIIYINDLPNCLSSSKPTMFADDTNLLKSSKHLQQLYAEMNVDANNLFEWFNANKLSLNTGKTFYIVFAKPKKQCIRSTIKINGTEICKKEGAQFLGMYVDNDLNWHEHIKNISSKINSSLYIINRVKHILSFSHLKTLYYALIHPHIEYGLVLWGNTHKTYVEKITILQKKAIRAICKKPYNYHSNELFYRCGILKVKEQHELKMHTYMYKFKNNSLPHILNPIFELKTKHHNYDTRESLFIYSPTQNIGRIANLNWSQLPEAIKSAPSLTFFKKKAKKYLLSMYSHLNVTEI